MTVDESSSQDSERKLRGSIAFFGHDIFESTLRKRIKAFIADGCHVVSFTFRRERDTGRPSPDWFNIDLGRTVDRNYLRRGPALIRGILQAASGRKLLRDADIFYARNIDMLAVAAVMKALTLSKARLVYEVLDIQRPFLRAGPVGWLFRAAERFLLGRSSLLVVSSQAFVDQYFQPVQQYSGPHFLLENKISGHIGPRPGALQDGKKDGPWVIGWFGVLRCTKSLSVLTQIADELGDKVQIYIRGRLSEEDLTSAEMASVVDARSNIVFGGSYASPEDLPTVYGSVHFSWCIDYLDAGTNSDWLLPNRLYEGGYFGSVALARSGTAVGAAVEERGLGWSLSEPLAHSVVRLLRELTTQDYERKRAAIRSMPRNLFVDEDDTHRLVDRMMETKTGRQTARTTR